MPEIDEKKVAKLVIKSQLATTEQVKECMAIQEQIRQNGQTPPSLLEVLIEKSFISNSQKETILKSLNKKHTRLFGEIAIDIKLIGTTQLQEALEIQERMKKSGQGEALGFTPYIGEILVSKNYLTPEAIDRILEEQNRLDSITQEKPSKKHQQHIDQTIVRPSRGASSKAEAKPETKLDTDEMVKCKNCGSQFNMKFLASSKRPKCGQCGQPLFGEAKPKAPMSLAQKITLSIPRLGRGKQNKVSIPGYQIMDTLGEDATGTTYHAVQLSDKTQVVLKVYNEETCADEKFIYRLKEAVGRLEAVHIPNTRKTLGIGFFEADGCKQTYLISEFIEGKSLRKVLQEATGISIEKATTITTRLAKILQYAQNEGLVHGDIALHNVLISKDGKVILANLGIPNKIVTNLLRIAESDGAAPLYIPPEVLDDKKRVDQRSDIYALGALYYHLLAKRPAFQGTSPFEILNRVSDNTPVPPIQVYNTQVSTDIGKIMEKMMEPDLEKRYNNYYELIAHLHDPHQIVQQQESVSSAGEQPEGADAETADAATETSGGQTLVRPMVPTEETKRRQEEESLRTLSQTRMSIAWQKPVFIAILLGTIGWFSYTQYQKSQELTLAKEEYYRVREYYTKQKKNVEKSDNLDTKLKMCSELEKKLRSYKERYRHLHSQFPKEENPVENIEYQLKDLDKFQATTINRSVAIFLGKADGFAKKNYLCAALEALGGDSIPESLRLRAGDQIARRREDYMKQAQQLIQKSQQQAETALKNLAAARSENRLAQDQLDLLQKSLDALDKTLKDLTEGANSKADLANLLATTEASIPAYKQKQIEHKSWSQEERQKKAQVIVQTIAAKLKPCLDSYDYNQATRILQQSAREKHPFPEVYEQIQKVQEGVDQLKSAKETLIRHLSRLNTKNLKVYHQTRYYVLDSVTEKDFSLKEGSKTSKKIGWQEFPKGQFSLLVEFILPYLSVDERVSLSIFTEGLANYALSYRLLQEAANEKQEAKTKLQALEKKLHSRMDELFATIQREDWDTQWEQSTVSALALKNQYLLPGIPYPEERNRHFNDFCRNIAYKLFGNEVKEQVVLDFRGQESRLPADTFQQASAKIEGGHLWFSGGSWNFSAKNIRGVFGLSRFSKENEKLEILLGKYRFTIEANGNVGYHIYQPTAKLQRAEFGSFGNRWIFFGLFVADNHVHWYLNSKKQFSYPHSSQETMDKITFKSGSSKDGGIYLDNLYLGLDIK